MVYKVERGVRIMDGYCNIPSQAMAAMLFFLTAVLSSIRKSRLFFLLAVMASVSSVSTLAFLMARGTACLFTPVGR